MESYKSQYLENFCKEHEVALEFHFRRNGKVMEEQKQPTELNYPFDELYQIAEKIDDNLSALKSGLDEYLNAGKSKRLQHEKLVKVRRAIEKIQALANGAEARFETIKWPEYKHPLPDSDKDGIVFLTDFERPVKCGEACNKSLSDKPMT